MRVIVLNGPNLGAQGSRQPEIYGRTTLRDVIADLVSFGERLGVTIEARQTDDEAELIGWVRDADADGMLLNPGALTHTSRALGDSVSATRVPVVEVHVSDVKTREPWRQVSVIEDACVATVYGRGVGGYRDAVRLLVNRAAMPFETVRYGPHPDNVGELRRGEGRGLVVLVHGGIWRHPYRRDTMDSLAVDLAQRGYDSWNVGYRTIGRGGGWPGSAHDTLTALHHAGRLASDPIAVVGHSAGGYLALWSSSRSATPVGVVVALAPIVDLAMGVEDAGELAAESQTLLDAGAPQTVGPGEVPTVAVHGREDVIVPPAHSRLLAASGATVDETDGGHFELLDPTKTAWQVTLNALEESLG
jgi:3-dehydroquinate dehydratase II